MSGGIFLEVRDLERRFGEVVAVAGLSFGVERGELFGLVGPDGAGKTTTLRMLAGVLRPGAGDALLEGVSIARRPEAVKPRLAYMSQRFGLYTDLTVLENLHFYADLYRVPRGEREARLARLFEFSRLEPFRHRLAGQLSGGMKQKLGLSCALVHEPDLLLLDEPTFGVDPVSRRELWRIVHEMVGRGVTAVVSTAYLDEAERFDRLALLHAGQALACDTPAALQRPLRGRVLEVAGTDPHRARDPAAELPGVSRAAVFGHHLHLTLDASPDAAGAEAAASGIQAALRRAGFPDATARPLEPGLEDVFLERVAGAVPAREAS